MFYSVWLIQFQNWKILLLAVSTVVHRKNWNGGCGYLCRVCPFPVSNKKRDQSKSSRIILVVSGKPHRISARCWIRHALFRYSAAILCLRATCGLARKRESTTPLPPIHVGETPYRRIHWFYYRIGDAIVSAHLLNHLRLLLLFRLSCCLLQNCNLRWPEIGSEY